MSQQLKVLVGDESEDFGEGCKQIFSEFGMEVILCKKDGRVLLDKAKTLKPDIILADVFMPNLDILGVKSGIEQLGDEKQPLIMAISPLDNDRLEKQILDAGISYFFLMPFDLKTMAQRILELSGIKVKYITKSENSNPQSNSKLEIDVTEVLHKVGVPPNLRGFYYA